MTHNVNDFSKVFALSHMVTGFPFALFTDFFLPIFAILLFIFLLHSHLLTSHLECVCTIAGLKWHKYALIPHSCKCTIHRQHISYFNATVFIRLNKKHLKSKKRMA